MMEGIWEVLGGAYVGTQCMGTHIPGVGWGGSRACRRQRMGQWGTRDASTSGGWRVGPVGAACMVHTCATPIPEWGSNRPRSQPQGVVGWGGGRAHTCLVHHNGPHRRGHRAPCRPRGRDGFATLLRIDAKVVSPYPHPPFACLACHTTPSWHGTAHVQGALPGRLRLPHAPHYAHEPPKMYHA